MDNFNSISKKIISRVMLLIIVSFVIVLSVITFTNILTVNKNIKKNQKNIRNSLIAKGKTLAINNSLAMRVMAEDNSFTAISSLVTSTVDDDDDLIYGIYMDHERMPWVYACPDNPKDRSVVRNQLTDSISLWAGSLEQPDYFEYKDGQNIIIEFAAPVIFADEILGHIRYGMSTESMEKAILEAKAAGRETHTKGTIIILFTAFISQFIGFLVLRQVAKRITSPIKTLAGSAKIIAEGKYDAAITIESNDEIGNLSEHFESMRVTIKKYTGHLQDMVNEKMRQVKDILNNIDQGLLTINLDGTVNPEYSSRANTILMSEDVSKTPIRDLLHFDTMQEEAFPEWLDLVRNRNKTMRWKKIQKLAPVQNVELVTGTGDSDKKYVTVSYQPIFNKKNELTKIMLLVMDETENRLKDLQLAAEQLQYENNVNTILTVANTPADEIAEFIKDTETRLKVLHEQVSALRSEAAKPFDGSSDQLPRKLTKENIDLIYRDLHTIKGNSGSYGFALLSHLAHQAEDLLEELRTSAETQRDTRLLKIGKFLDDMDKTLDDIHAKMKLIFGDDEEVAISIPQTRISDIINLCHKLKPVSEDSKVRKLVNECIILSWKPLKMLFRKYLKLALKIGRSLQKPIEVIIENETALYPGDILVDLDDVLIHLIRNSIDHGIEDAKMREEVGKSMGRLLLSLRMENDSRVITISDDGKGINTDLLVEACIGKKLFTRDEADRLTPEEKMDLLFTRGVSTSSEVSNISGRGMGMQIVREKVVRLGGTLTVASQIGKGTTFTVTVPVSKVNDVG